MRHYFYRAQRVAPIPAPTPADVRTWLEAHPAAWHGWPTYGAIDGADDSRRWARLRQHGCPTGPTLGTWETAIQRIRMDRRKTYRQHVGVVTWT